MAKAIQVAVCQDNHGGQTTIALLDDGRIFESSHAYSYEWAEVTGPWRKETAVDRYAQVDRRLELLEAENAANPWVCNRPKEGSK